MSLSVGLGCVVFLIFLLLLLRFEKRQPVFGAERAALGESGRLRLTACKACGRQSLWIRLSCPYCGAARFSKSVLACAGLVVALESGRRLHNEGIGVWTSAAFIVSLMVIGYALLRIIGVPLTQTNPRASRRE